VELSKKENWLTILKSNIFRPVATINDSSVAYNFNVLTDLEDEIIGSK
jgi:hypothetical protein